MHEGIAVGTVVYSADRNSPSDLSREPSGYLETSRSNATTRRCRWPPKDNMNELKLRSDGQSQSNTQHSIRYLCANCSLALEDVQSRCVGFTSPVAVMSGLELVEALNEWHWNNNCFHDHVLQFAKSHELILKSDEDEHSHELYRLHEEFRQLLEGFVASFLDHYGSTLQDLEAALLEAQASDDLYITMSSEVVREELFALLDYQAFQQTMLRAIAVDAESHRPVGAPADDDLRDSCNASAVGSKTGSARNNGYLS